LSWAFRWVTRLRSPFNYNDIGPLNIVFGLKVVQDDLSWPLQAGDIYSSKSCDLGFLVQDWFLLDELLRMMGTCFILSIASILH
jgi:hypothetical protein